MKSDGREAHQRRINGEGEGLITLIIGEETRRRQEMKRKVHDGDEQGINSNINSMHWGADIKQFKVWFVDREPHMMEHLHQHK